MVQLSAKVWMQGSSGFGRIRFSDIRISVLHCVSFQLVSIAENILDRKPGDWFGPAATAHLLKAALDKTARLIKKIDQNILSNFKIYVAQDTTVYRQDVLDMCVRSNNLSKENSPNFDETFEEEGFSILNRESAEILIAESGRNESSYLEASMVAGVPYFLDNPGNFVRVERSQVRHTKLDHFFASGKNYSRLHHSDIAMYTNEFKISA